MNMREAFDVMAEHWALTMWLGIVIMVALNRSQIKIKDYNYYVDKLPNNPNND